MRIDGRQTDELRPITFERDFTDAPAGSVLTTFGNTRVLCTASIDEDVPRWMKGREGLGHGRVLDAPGVVDRTREARSEGRSPVGPHARDPTVDRPLVASRLRHGGA